MLHADILWDLEDDPDGNVRHIELHGITVQDVEDVIDDPDNSTEISKSSDRFITFGATRDGRFLAVVWESAEDDPLVIYPVTAYAVPRPRPELRNGKRR